MPIYEYECPKCGRFETIQKISERPLSKHEACGSKVKRVMSAGTFSFKGSGFYATDYKGGSTTAAASGGAEKPAAPAACASCPSSPSSGSKAA